MDKKRRVKLDEPLAYRDKDGTMKLYEPGEAPVYWKTDDDKKGASETGSRKNRTGNEQVGGLTLIEDGSHSTTGASGSSSPLTVIGERYTLVTPKLKSRTEQTRFASTKDEIVVPVSPAPDVKVARKRRKDIMPDEMSFKHIDEHAMKAPPLTKEDLPSLVEYLVSVATNAIEQVRAFYVWITHNINYDTSGYFGRAPLKPTDPVTVLQNRLTVCEGYVRLMEAFCRAAEIPVKIICGYAKAYGCQAGEDVTNQQHNAHAWNAVFLENDWFLLDVTWGAGFVKTREKRYVAKFNNAYFLTDPEVFLTDHFPSPVNGYEKYDGSSNWQLLSKPMSKKEFIFMVNFDTHGKEWGIQTVSHPHSIIENIENETDIILQETYVQMADYIAVLYEDGRKLDTFVYTYKLTDKQVNIHVCLPRIGVFTLQAYGRRLKDGAHADFQPIVKYVLQCSRAYKDPLPYPSHHTMYGPSRDLNKYGVKVGKVYHVADEGEIILKIKPNRYIDLFPRLHYQDHGMDLKQYCFVDYSDCFQYINIIVRFRYEGHYKLILFARKETSSKFTPFMTYLIKSTKACTDGHFPVAHEYALRYKCCILEPLSKSLPPISNVFICIKSPTLTQIKCGGTILEKMDDVTFEGTVQTPTEGEKFAIVGCDKSAVFHPIYSYNTSVPFDL